MRHFRIKEGGFGFVNIRKGQGLPAVRGGMTVLAVASLFLLLLIFADLSRLVASTSQLASTFWTVFRSALASALATSVLLTISAALGFALRRNFCAGFLAASVAAVPIALCGEGVAVAAVAAGILLGVGFGFALVCIEAELHCFSRAQALFVSGAGLFLAALMKLVLVSAFPSHLGTAVWFALYAMVALLLVGSIRPVKTPLSEASAPAPKHDLGEFFQHSWINIGCLLLCVFTIGCMWGANSESLVIRSDAGEGVSIASTLGSLLAGALLLAIGIIAARGRTAAAASAGDILCKVGSLACISILVVAWLLQTSGLDTLGPSASFNPVLGFCDAAIGAIFLTAFSRESCSRAVLPLAASLVNVIVLGFALLVMSLYPYLEDALAQSISISLRIVFLTVVAFSLLRRRPQREDSEAHRRERELAAIYGLSERETEILVLLLEKRSAPYIAEKLFISSNTVKTHIRRIYEKTGVHSRDQLIDLFWQ